MYGLACGTGGEQQDHSLDLAPAAEMLDMAALTAAVRSRCGFARGKVAEARDQVGGLGRRRTIGQMDVKVQRFSQSCRVGSA